MSIEPMFDPESIEHTILEANRRRAWELADMSRQGAMRARWGGLSALVVFCLSIMGWHGGGPNGGAGGPLGG
jgi:hypothetical protein